MKTNKVTLGSSKEGSENIPNALYKSTSYIIACTCLMWNRKKTTSLQTFERVSLSPTMAMCN